MASVPSTSTLDPTNALENGQATLSSSPTALFPPLFTHSVSAAGTVHVANAAVPISSIGSNMRNIVVFGGGTATNSLVDVFEGLREGRGCGLSYVIPISDNGGSSSELIRVFGGPGIGDIRSRLVRLIPSRPTSDTDLSAIRALFNHRLSVNDASAARAEWLDVVEGRHMLWSQISSEKRELVRSFFSLVNLEITKRARPGQGPAGEFCYARAAVGNLFLTGARLFTGSLESAIYLLSQICGIPSHTNVLPAISTSFTHHISAGLTDETVITGQNAISHPSVPTRLPDSSSPLDTELDSDSTDVEDANLPGTLPSLRRQNITFSKSSDESDDLPAPITRIWYINPYGHEIHPRANPKVLRAVDNAAAVVYSVGSLYTSIVPSLVLKGVGRAISHTGVGRINKTPKVLILNSSTDRETGPRDQPCDAVGFVKAIVRACWESQGRFDHLNGNIPVHAHSKRGNDQSGTETAETGMLVYPPSEVRLFVTHLIHLEGEGVPTVDKAELVAMGVDCIRVYGRRTDDGSGEMRYDAKALEGALEAILGREMGRSRRNTKE